MNTEPPGSKNTTAGVHKEPLALVVHTATFHQPLQWLQRGWGDLMRCPVPGLLHGAASLIFGALLVLLARDSFWLMAGAFSGFLIVAPVVATGLYAISRALEQGQRPGIATVVQVWRSGDTRLVRFGLLLALAGTGWVLTSASLVTGWSQVPILKPSDFLRHVVLADGVGLFEAWLMLGGALAAPIFASSVVAIPLLLDRPCSLMQAVLTSWRVVLAAPAVLAFWAALIMGITLLGMASALLGLVVAVPWLAHASWHAYRDLIGSAQPSAARPPASSRQPAQR